MRQIRRRKRAGVALAATLVLAVVGGMGCEPQTLRTPGNDAGPPVGKIDFLKDPATGRTYHLYVPTTYTPKRRYPLVITAHGTFPFDHAAGQRDRWVGVAERHGLIVCAPDFDAATGLLGVPEDRPAPELLRDEKAVLHILDALQARYRIDPDAVMITGWSAGGYPAHFIGLRHPDRFRCIVGRTANFSPHLVTDATARRARHLHVYVYFGEGDLPGFDAMNRQANAWYTLRQFPNFEIRRMPGGHDPSPVEAARYFLKLIGRWPAVGIRASRPAGADPRTVRLRALVRDPDSPGNRVDSILWQLGDETVDLGATVLHTYPGPGVYNVFLTVVDLDGRREYAQAWLKID